LFHAAILQSPSRVLLPDPELKTPVNGITPMESVGAAIAPHIAEIRRWNTAKIVQQAKTTTDRLYAPGGEAKLGIRPESHIHMPAAHDVPWWAFVDGWVIPKQTETLYRSGAATAVPVMAGANANEGSVFLRNFPIQTEPQYVDYLSQNYQPCYRGMFDLYKGADAPTIKAAVDRIITDALFLYGARGILQAESRKKQKVFLYQFARTVKNPEYAPLGAWHGADVPYVFGFANPASDPQRFNETDEKISDEMMERWAQFARNANPNGNRSTNWPLWNEQDESYLEFNAQTKVNQLPSHLQNRFKMFEQIFSLHPGKTCNVAP
jgi:para-nitrobenzyl esterase